MILGGAARVFGPVVGPMIFWVLLVLVNGVLSEAVQSRATSPFMDIDAGRPVPLHAGRSRLILLLIFRPQGIFGDKREMALDAR